MFNTNTKPNSISPNQLMSENLCQNLHINLCTIDGAITIKGRAACTEAVARGINCCRRWPLPAMQQLQALATAFNGSRWLLTAI